MFNDNRKVRVQYVRCPNEAVLDTPHWLLVAWDARTNSTKCRYHDPEVPVRLREPLKKGMVDDGENARAWTTVEPDPYDENRYQRLNNLPLVTFHPG